MHNMTELESELNERFQWLVDNDPLSQRLMGKLEILREQNGDEHQGLGEENKNGQVELQRNDKRKINSITRNKSHGTVQEICIKESCSNCWGRCGVTCIAGIAVVACGDCAGRIHRRTECRRCHGQQGRLIAYSIFDEAYNGL